MAENDKAAGGQGSHRVGRGARQEGDGIDPKEALRIANETIEQQRSTIQTLGTQVEQVSSAAADAQLARISERETTITNALSAAEMAMATAKSAFRSARESNDLEAETTAMDLLADAKLEHQKWAYEKQKFEASKPKLIENAKKTAQPGAGANAEYEANAKRWITEHPKFTSDNGYKNNALDAHAAALARGHAPGSPGYIDYINEKLSVIYGKDHGQMTDRKDGDRGGGRERDGGGDRYGAGAGAPPGGDSRGGFSAHGVTLIRNSDGTKSVSGRIPQEWVEGAKWTGMSEAAYAVSMLELEEEAEQGHSSVVQMGDGRIYR